MADYASFVIQRKDEGARALREARERHLRRAAAIKDTQVRRAFERDVAAEERAIADFWRRFYLKIPRQRGSIDGQAGGESQHKPPSRSGDRPRPGKQSGIATTARQLAAYTAPVRDAAGRQGVFLMVRYLSARTASLGCARRLARYIVAPDHIEYGEEGEALVVSNMGESATEMASAFSLMEDLNRSARANAKVAFHVIVQLPYDVTPAERLCILSTWCEAEFGNHNLPYVAAVHTPDAEGDPRNTHAHVAFSFRPMVRVAPFTFDAARELKAERDNPEAFRSMRERFATVMTEVCRSAGHDRTYTGLSYVERGLKIRATEHLGPHKTKAVRRGEYVSANARNRETVRRNEAILAIERLKRRQVTLKRRLAWARALEARRIVVPVPRQPVLPKAEQNKSIHQRVQPNPQPHVVIAEPASSRRQPTPVEQITSPVIVSSSGKSMSASAPIDLVTVRRKPVLVQTAVRVPLARRQAPSAETITLPPIAVRPPAIAPTAISPVVTIVGRDDAASPPHMPMPQVRAAIASVSYLTDKINWPRTRMGVTKPAGTNAVTLPQPVQRPVSSSVPIDPSLIELALQAMMKRSAKRQAQRRHMALTGLATVERSDQRHDTTPPGAGHASTGAVPPTNRVPPHRSLHTTGAMTGKAAPAITSAVSAMPSATSTPMVPREASLVERIRQVDAYLYDDGAGRLMLDPVVAKQHGLAGATLDGPAVQAGLLSLRANQQRVMTTLVDEATRRPLDFAVGGRRPWPSDLPASILTRLDQWSCDEGFAHELFLNVLVRVSAAKDAAFERQRQRTPLIRLVREAVPAVPVRSSAARPAPVVERADGIRGTTPPAHQPVHQPGPSGAPARPFDQAGRPTPLLIQLLLHAGRYHHTIALATDGRLTVIGQTSAITRSLVDQWRGNEAVHTLLMETLSASRAAGRPVWPPAHDTVIRAAGKLGRSASPILQRPDRDITE